MTGFEGIGGINNEGAQGRQIVGTKAVCFESRTNNGGRIDFPVSGVQNVAGFSFDEQRMGFWR
jgi:hypothetical protein